MARGRVIRASRGLPRGLEQLLEPLHVAADRAVHGSVEERRGQPVQTGCLTLHAHPCSSSRWPGLVEAIGDTHWKRRTHRTHREATRRELDDLVHIFDPLPEKRCHPLDLCTDADWRIPKLPRTPNTANPAWIVVWIPHVRRNVRRWAFD